MRTLLPALAAILTLAVPLPAQNPAAEKKDPDPDVRATGGGTLPAGWQLRLDKAAARAEDVKFVTMGSGLHATTGPAAIFYNPAYKAEGQFRARATFTLTRPSRHPEAYGLFIGGKELDSDQQDYLYFLVRQDGKYLVKHRAGPDTHELIAWTAHTAIKQPDESGKATNALAIDVGARAVRFLVNGAEVGSLERVPYLNVNGLVGLRVNHNLDVHIANFGVAAPAKARADAQR